MSAESGRVERRTQQQRREASIAKLIDAAIETIIADGYYRTTVAAVAARARLSVGALFRHFDSRLDLIARVAEELSRRILAAADIALESTAGQPAAAGGKPIESALSLLSALTNSALVAAWHEMMVAARTDAELRDRIAPALPPFYAGILERARRLGILDELPEHMHELVTFSFVHMFSGAALTGSVYPRPDLDARRIPLAAYYVERTAEL